MAVSGTITATRTNRRDWKVTILGLTTASTSPAFDGLGYPIGSFTAQGTFGSSTPSLTLTGSNDGGLTWFTVGSALTSVGAGGMIGSNNEIFEKYQFAMSGGDGTTNVNIYVFLSATFG